MASLKTKGMRNILDPIALQLEKLTQLRVKGDTKPSINAVESLLLEQFDSLSEKLAHVLSDEDLSAERSKIIELIHNLYPATEENHNVDGSRTPVAECLEVFERRLKKLEKLECEETREILQVTHDYVKEMGEEKQIEDLQNIRELGITLLDMIGPLQTYARNLVSQLLKEKIALCASQILVGFSMLVILVQEQYNIKQSIFTTKQYVCNRICSCLQIMIDVFDCENPSADEESFEKESHFVFKMDLALDLILDLPKYSQDEQVLKFNELWVFVEEIFCHAMLIAQVCEQENFEAISGTCRTIISEYENLKTQLAAEKPDTAMNSLYINSFTDALYRLERRVNISVLSLVMEVFTNPFEALKKLVRACGSSLPANIRRPSDLDTRDFDVMTDKMMQIGLYAVACCRDANRATKIKNHLASLESLELELISMIKAFYHCPDNTEFRAGAKILTTQWQQEVNSLCKALGLIIDSAAYCQVIWDDLQLKVQGMYDCLDNRQTVTQNQVKLVVHRACTLATLITVTIDDIGHENIDKQTIMMIRELKAAIFEADASAKCLLGPNLTEPQQLRVIKRCELVLNVVKRLQPALQLVMDNSQSRTVSVCEKSRIGQGDIFNDSGLNFPQSFHQLSQDETTICSYIKTPYSVSNHKPPVTIQSPNTVPKTPPSLSRLIPYIERGRTMRLEKSIIYRQSGKSNREYSSARLDKNARNLSNVRQHLFSRDSFISDSLDLSCVSLNLTEILEKVTSFSGSTESLSDGNHSPVSSLMVEEAEGIKRSTRRDSATIGGGDAPSAIETPERINDIHRLEKRIEILQKQNQSSY